MAAECDSFEHALASVMDESQGKEGDIVITDSQETTPPDSSSVAEAKLFLQMCSSDGAAHAPQVAPRQPAAKRSGLCSLSKSQPAAKRRVRAGEVRDGGIAAYFQRGAKAGGSGGGAVPVVDGDAGMAMGIGKGNQPAADTAEGEGEEQAADSAKVEVEQQAADQAKSADKAKDSGKRKAKDKTKVADTAEGKGEEQPSVKAKGSGKAKRSDESSGQARARARARAAAAGDEGAGKAKGEEQAADTAEGAGERSSKANGSGKAKPSGKDSGTGLGKAKLSRKNAKRSGKAKLSRKARRSGKAKPSGNAKRAGKKARRSDKAKRCGQEPQKQPKEQEEKQEQQEHQGEPPERVQGLSLAVELSVPDLGPRLRCSRCRQEVDPVRGHLSGKALGIFRCNVCNTRATQLNRLPQWNEFRNTLKDFPPEKKESFWKEAAETAGTADLRKLLAEHLTTTREEADFAESSGSYQPLSWYEKQGYNTELIEQRCGDTRTHPIFGKVYRVAFDSSGSSARNVLSQTKDLSSIAVLSEGSAGVAALYWPRPPTPPDREKVLKKNRLVATRILARLAPVSAPLAATLKHKDAGT